MDRRDFLKATAATTAGLIVPQWLAEETSASASVTDASCLWGAYAAPIKGLSPTAAYRELERKIGRKLAVTRHYQPFDTVLPGQLIRWSAYGGRIPYISFKARHHNGDPITWSSIIAGRHDAFLRDQAFRLKSWNKPAYICFHHEPEDDPDCGSPYEFARAYARVRNIFVSHGAHKLAWVITLMASTYAGGNGGPHRWLPKQFRHLGVDGYNRFPCVSPRLKHPWKPFREIFAPARQFAAAMGKGLFIGEVGCVEQDDCGYRTGDPLAKARWFKGMGATIQNWPEVRALVYTSAPTRHQGYPMEYQVDSSLPSLNAYRTVGLRRPFTG
ncbi:MAG: twin-arginine translocation signal domain-containing protein [Actinomycetota bacterium]|nr:twin-arginine translocation signal domain-containing protein [Actinomycetota bacterium]